jgi:hypothetical protein
MQQHRTIDVGDATLECALCGVGATVVLLANAGCSTGYFDHLACALVTGGFQTISINMRGVGGSSGFLDGVTLHDLARDVAGVIKAIGCGPAHLVGHAFGNRIARCPLSGSRSAAAGSQRDAACSGWPHRAFNADRHALPQCDAGQDEWQRLRHRSGGALALASIRSENTCARQMLACGLYRASRDQSERTSRILVERRYCLIARADEIIEKAANVSFWSDTVL